MKLIVALDLSDKDNSVVSEAVKLAEAANADVVLMHVVNPFVDSAGVEAATRSEAVERISGEVRAYLESQGKAFSRAPQVLVPLVQRGGEDVISCIARVAGEMGADILVVASKKASGLRGLILGSVVQALLSNSPCPLLVVRPK